MLTINNPTEEEWNQLDELEDDEKVKDLICQLECGEEGTEHIQCFINFVNPRTFQSVKKAFPRAHIDIVKDFIKAAQYCMKEDTRVEDGRSIQKVNSPKLIKLMEQGTEEHGTRIGIEENIEDPFEDLTISDWQNEIIELVKTKPHRRTVHWYWEGQGQVGKSTLAKYLVINNDDIIMGGGKAADVKHSIANMIIESKGKRAPKVVIFDISRQQDKFVSYQAIEDVKNGCFFSGKFDSRTIAYNIPHVICFANNPPNINALSHDRWNIVEINSRLDAP